MTGNVPVTSQHTGSLLSVPVVVNSGTAPADPGNDIVSLCAPILQVISIIVAPGKPLPVCHATLKSESALLRNLRGRFLVS